MRSVRVSKVIQLVIIRHEIRDSSSRQCSIIFFSAMGIELRTFDMLGTLSTTELYPHTSYTDTVVLNAILSSFSRSN